MCKWIVSQYIVCEQRNIIIIHVKSSTDQSVVGQFEIFEKDQPSGRPN